MAEMRLAGDPDQVLWVSDMLAQQGKRVEVERIERVRPIKHQLRKTIKTFARDLCAFAPLFSQFLKDYCRGCGRCNPCEN